MIITMDITLDHIFLPSEDVVARVIEDELIIVPLVAGMGDSDDELYTMNETGRAIWSRFDGIRTLRGIVAELEEEYEVTSDLMEQDVLGLAGELVRRKMVVVR